MNKILVIEDEAAVRENLVELLDAEGFEVRGAEDGAAGLDVVQVWTPDLILCDVMMPSMDGFAVLDILRRDPQLNGIMFIFLTALSERGKIRQGMDLGADDYLTKPFTRTEVLDAIHARIARLQALQQRRLADIQAAETRLLFTDYLTQLPSIFALRDHFQRLIARTSKIAFVSIGLDHFEEILATLGIAASDQVICTIARRLQLRAPPSSVLTRLQVDKFLLLLPLNESQHSTIEVAQNLLDAVRQPIVVDQQELCFTASLGIAHYPQDGLDVADLITKNSLIALRTACGKGGNQAVQFRPQITNHDLVKLETELCLSIERGELRVYYQPRVELSTGRIGGAEALVRWQHPERGLISPGVFIPLAQEIGLLPKIDTWMLEQVVAQLACWQQSCYSLLRVSVNQSGPQLEQPGFVDQVVDLLRQYKIPTHLLELEMTESYLMKDLEDVTAKLEILRALGIEVAVDDFGTGYSSLSQISKLPVSQLKIDRSFIQDIEPDTQRALIIRTIIQLGLDLSLCVVGEGVETQTELEFLHQHHCDQVQGYFFSRPVPLAEFEALAAQGVLEMPWNR